MQQVMTRPTRRAGSGGLWTLALCALAGCSSSTVPAIEYEILGTFPHDPAAYTQGLLFHDGHLLESTGRYGESGVRRVDVPTGEV